MNKKIIITILLALVAMTGQAQEERIDTVIPKFLSNGYFFREMPTLPDGGKTMSQLKDKEGEPFPQFSEKDMDGRTWTNDSVKGRVMVLNLWYSGCGPCRAEMPILSEWKNQLPGVMFFSATYHDAETAKRITDKHHFTWTHLIEAKDMMAWIGTEGFPLTIVVDKKGIVRHTVHGTNEDKRAELLAKIKEADAE